VGCTRSGKPARRFVDLKGFLRGLSQVARQELGSDKGMHGNLLAVDAVSGPGFLRAYKRKRRSTHVVVQCFAELYVRRTILRDAVIVDLHFYGWDYCVTAGTSAVRVAHHVGFNF
jgi:hypothetical protein